MNEYAEVCKLLKRVAEEGVHFDNHFEEDGKSNQDITPFVQHICYGVMRHWFFLDAVTDALSKKPLPDKHLDLRILIMAGLYSIDELNRPAHASVNAAVETTRQLKKAWASSLVNAILRRYLREKESVSQRVESMSSEAKFNHPAWMISAFQKSWPDYPELFEFNNCQAPMTLRVNLHKISRGAYVEQLNQQGISARTGQLVGSSVLLSQSLPVAELPGFAEGLVSVQDEAPQLAAWLLAPQPGDKVLDACAAPGGKTGHLLEFQPEIHLVALDRDRKRIGRIAENLERLELSAEVICADLNDLENSRQFDRILIDVPCSATGIMRRHPDIKLLRTQEDVDKLSALQRALLNKAIDLLKPGGSLLYSTCSILPEENDAIVDAVVNERNDTFMKSLTLPHEPHSEAILKTSTGWQMLPTESEHDGFFYSLLGETRHMKIIILGAGEVGGNLAQNLTHEAGDITVVDTDSDRLRELQDRFDIRTVRGMASHPQVLRQAGAEDADMLIAVTNSDEVNMVACQIAFTVFNTPTKIARIRSSAYIRDGGIFRNDAMPVDVIVNPEAIVTHDIRRLIDNPGALQVMDFAEGQAQLVGIKAYYGGPLVDQELRYLRQHMPAVDTRVAAIFRKNRPIIPQGNTVIEADDEVFFIAAAPDIKNVMSEMRRAEKPNKRIVIAGGGHIGEHLARTIENRYGVRIIEHNRQRCYELSETLDRTIVLAGDASDRELLLEENIEETDVFCAVTNDDEANIMSSMLAKSLGARKVITLINNPAYVDLIEDSSIDIAINPQQATLGSILAHIRQGDVARVHSLRRGAAEAIEAIAHGDRNSSKVVGRRIEEIELPPGTTIGAIVRGDKVVIAHDDILVESDDHVILFLVDKKRIKDVEKLFQAPLSFF